LKTNESAEKLIMSK